MHYLEDDLDLLESVPEEVKRQCYEMRELDTRAERALADVRAESRAFFNALKSLSAEERARRCKKIKEAYQLVREISEEKLAIAEFLELMLEKYQERIAKDLSEFKAELETDTPGITDSIEKELCASLHSAHPPQPSRKVARSAGIAATPTTAAADASSGADNSSAHGVAKHAGSSAFNFSAARIKFRSGSVSEYGLESRYSSDEKRQNTPTTTMSATHRADGKADRKHSRPMGCASFATLKMSSSSSFSPSSSRHKEKRLKMMNQQYSAPSASSSLSPMPATPSKSGAAAGATSGAHKLSAWPSSMPSTPLSSHRAAPNAGGGSASARYALHRPSLHAGSGSLASSSASTTPSPPMSASVSAPFNCISPSAMPTFAGGQESQYGRPVKTTKSPIDANGNEIGNGNAVKNTTRPSLIIPKDRRQMAIKSGIVANEVLCGFKSVKRVYTQRRTILLDAPLTPPSAKSRAAARRAAAKNERNENLPKTLTSRVQQMLKDRQSNRVGRLAAALPPARATSTSASALGADENSFEFRRHTESASSGGGGGAPAAVGTYRRRRLTTAATDEMDEGTSSGRATPVGRGMFDYDEGEEMEEKEEPGGSEEEDAETSVSEENEPNDEEATMEENAAAEDDDEEEEEDSEDQDNHVWCICQQKSEGDMVACDNKMCPYEWFHYACVGITAPPRGKWYCPECSAVMRRSRSMESR